MVPPQRLNFVGSKDFLSVGETWVRHFVDLAGLTPDMDTLDIGCGIGRMAIPLARFLKGRYEGFDIVPKGIRWCQRHITPRHPNFRFQLADVANPVYRPNGTPASQYAFPYPDTAFDFAFATSVFTHLRWNAVQRYVAETARVLRPGGRFLASLYLIDDEARELMGQGKSTLRFVPLESPSYTATLRQPEAAVAFETEAVYGLFTNYGLQILHTYPGH
jgi:SAM-dependent methyltransferase